MSSNGDRAHLVHETRKAIKRMRALARLLRCQIGEGEFRRVDAALRDAGRELAGARDAAVRAATLRQLRERHPEVLAIAPIDALAVQLEREGAGSADGSGNPEPVVLRDVDRMRGELLLWQQVDYDTDALTRGLRLLYRSGRRRYRNVKRSHGCDPQRMHDWRKRVKGLYYALDMLGGKQAHAMAAITRRAERLGDVLGDEHDLWMLAEYVSSERAPAEETARALLLELIERRREQLRMKALRLGSRLYSRKPARFAKRARAALRA
ncbi:MAG TPA: CHAD domain-containing protein [Solirubrobacteraceae bacterium]|jgi:CHAD domain-containing protein|nr:CHAD domain-containing protein [Solirubrobacteraceae bacterium]